MFLNIPSSSSSLLSPTFCKMVSSKSTERVHHLDSGIDYVKLFEGRAVGPNGVDVDVKVNRLHFEGAQLRSFKWGCGKDVKLIFMCSYVRESHQLQQSFHEGSEDD